MRSIQVSFENQLGSVMSRLRQTQAVHDAIEADLSIEKEKLRLIERDLKLIQEQLRPKE
jgi:hypothetical protein